jgi:hypothetical protein
MPDRIFFPQSAVDRWLVDDRVDFQGQELTLKGPGRAYRVEEAVYVEREVTGAAEPHNLLGRVRTRAALESMGAEILESSMLLGDNAYDVVMGFAAEPIGTFAQYAATKGATHETEEALLLAFAAGGGPGAAP